MPRIHLLTPTLSSGDAVSNDLLGMLDWFHREKHEAYAYAQYLDQALRAKARPLAAYESYLTARDDVLIYHHSVGWDPGLALFERSRNRKVLRYHSITPARFFRRYHPPYAHSCLEGELQTRASLRLDPELVLADSNFNAQELAQAGGDRASCRVVPPFHPIDDLDLLPEEEALADELQGWTNLVFVGRVVPNKGHLHLIRAFAHYHHRFDRASRLFFVGKLDDRLASYLDELEREIARQRLDDAVYFAGNVTGRQLKTYYTHASLFWCASEHEGFGVPLVEAMYYRIPIVAYGTSAVRSTLGETGLIWDTPDPALFAESTRLIRENEPARERVVQNQWERYVRCFTPEVIEDTFEEAMASVLPESAYA